VICGTDPKISTSKENPLNLFGYPKYVGASSIDPR
jgi:hypothetical protein